MGEIAEMMLDGILCQGCGVYMHGESHGIPRSCSDCRRHSDSGPAWVKVACKTCGKYVKPAGLADHIKAVHAKATGA